ncbi:hypothetical protein [Gemmatimonas sp.]|uniref:DoxX family protein n=1 Tax=Gemmatimonas sp. TaxID=1962908 RepID=UPI003983B3B5
MFPLAVLGPAALFFIAGGLHFVMPGFFDRIMPPWIPNARLATYVSGAFEIAGAIGLLIPATRVAAAWGLIALLAAVLPANIHMLNEARAANASAGYIAGLWVRLPLQPLLMWWVWRVAIRR